MACLALANYKHFNVSLGNILIINEDKIMHHTTNPKLPKLPRSHARGRQQGFSIIELMIVLAVAGMLIVGALVAGTTVMNGVKSNRYVNEISTIVTQARGWKGIKTDYTDITIQKLIDMGRLTTKTNADGGAYLLAAVTGANEFTLSSAGMEKKTCEDVAEQIRAQTTAAVEAVAATTGENATAAVPASGGAICADNGTLTATFK